MVIITAPMTERVAISLTVSVILSKIEPVTTNAKQKTAK